ncbi:hypothetical protein H4582DRAFT_1911939 [Lactarius indigo]|nr:hypothetical protein H4582DRAFT_1911939 [Lactarius indigo]
MPTLRLSLPRLYPFSITSPLPLPPLSHCYHYHCVASKLWLLPWSLCHCYRWCCHCRHRRVAVAVVVAWMSSPLSLPAVRGGHGVREWLRRHGRLGVGFAILDGVDEAPAVCSDARVDVHTSTCALRMSRRRDKRRVGPLYGDVPMTHRGARLRANQFSRLHNGT